MDTGQFSVALRTGVLHFNGKLFKNPEVLPLDRDQIGLVLEAAKFDWRDVEPAIFGTLLERALAPDERHKLGAHYTPRAYVERLVLPTVVEPLRSDWKNAQAAALVLAAEGKLEEARAQVRGYHKALCEVRVLDPACGSGNFLYVTLEHLKRLEGEVLNQLDELGDTRGRLELEGISVDPHQFLGIEINPRAAALAELVLWIGYLQWHFRTRGQAAPPQPILKDFHNVECRDAVLAYDSVEFVTDERGLPLSRWDGKTMKKHPVTGEDVPDELARTVQERYVNPKKAEWPEADFVVGNPPFIGAGWMRTALGDGYAEALRQTWKEVPESADLVMYWWNKTAYLARNGKLRRFGLITTNSLRQPFNRRVIEQHMAAKPPLSLAFAIPDHPWVDSADGAAVRIAMSVGQAGDSDGQLLTVIEERETGEDAQAVSLSVKAGRIHADLTVGANVAAAGSLQSNGLLTSRGIMLFGAGFIVTREEAAGIALGRKKDMSRYIREYRNGRDLTDRPRDVLVIDLFGLSVEEVRARCPEIYQWILDRVKPERDQNRDASISRNWWLHGRPRPELRGYLKDLARYIATVETAKHRTFQFLDTSILPDNKLIAIALSDALDLGILSSAPHLIWSLAAGSTLEDRPVYVKTTCFETYPFPAAIPVQQSRIRDLAEQLDAHRKRQQAQHAELTLTGMYNVLEKLKAGTALNTKEKVIHAQGLVAVLKQYHDELDLAVLEAYGWSDLAPLMQVINGNAAPGSGGTPATREEARQALDATLLERLVALNAERAAEEQKGLIRWLRPEFQTKAKQKPQTQIEIDTGEEVPAVLVAKDGKLPWPKELPSRIRLVSQILSSARVPLSDAAIAARIAGKGNWKQSLPPLIDTLIALGRARRVKSGVLAID